MSLKPKIVILGGGPTGLGAALRCTDLGHENWLLVDEGNVVGGLSRSFLDSKGFTWDIGGHVIFSHYVYFDDAMNYAVQEWNERERESWVWVRDRWVPYPFQNNIHRLPNDDKQACLDGLIDVYRASYDTKPLNFEEYFTRQFGAGIAKIFMSPYNFKVWAVPPKMMSTEWTGERVATVDLKKICRNIIHNTDDLGWGPNHTFRFPVHGGTGGIWQALGDKLPQDKLKIGAGNSVVSIDAGKKKITLKSGEIVSYDKLISTIPIDDLLRITTGPFDTSKWTEIADQFVFSTTHVIGLGIKGICHPHLKKHCWMYFPEENSPFYRCTVFSNYSEFNAPEGHWSLMLEVSESKFKPVVESQIIEETIKGCIASNLLMPEDEIVSTWHTKHFKGYPTPFVGRNDLLDQVQPVLKAADIYSRGRFGGWKYEVGNQDHSMMQGVEAVESILGVGEEITYFKPNTVNAGKETTRHLGLLKK